MRSYLLLGFALSVGCSGGDFGVGAEDDAAPDSSIEDTTSETEPVDSSEQDSSVDTGMGADTMVPPDTTVGPDTSVDTGASMDTGTPPVDTGVDTTPPPDTSVTPDMGVDTGPPPICGSTVKPDDALGVYVNPISAGTGGDGSRGTPYSTISAAFAGAKASGKRRIYLAPGTYTGSFTVGDLPTGVSIQGGFDVSGITWTVSCDTSARALATIVGDGPVTVLFDTIQHESELRRLTVKTKAKGTTAAGAVAESRIAVLVRNSTATVRFADVFLSADNANDGAPAAPTGPGVASPCAFTCGTGDPGTPGGGGAPASTMGAFGAGGFTPADGAAATTGGVGSNGKPPGPPGSMTGCNTGCEASPDPTCSFQTCMPVGSVTVTGGTGSCGCGGGGGGAGQAGHGGGASVALLAVSSKIDIVNSRLQSNNGGGGTAGSPGGPGVAGTNGSAGAPANCGTGCTKTCSSSDTAICTRSNTPVAGGSAGGTGGTGGNGGTGGGGAGGPSYAYVNVSSTIGVSVDTVLQHGTGGSGGGFGVAGVSADHN